MQAGLLLTDGGLSVGLSPRGGMLAGGTLAGRPFLAPAGPGEAACFPMVPLCNRVSGIGFSFEGRSHHLTPNAEDQLYLHGDGWLADWQVEAQEAGHAVLAYRHDRGPFRYACRQSVRLSGNTLQTALSLRNLGDAAMPFGMGFHPYFPRAGAKVAFSAARHWSEGPGHLPGAPGPIPEALDFTAPRPLPVGWQNNGYEHWRSRASLCWPDLRLDLTADPLFGTLMLYAPDTTPDFFCLEPMSHLPDALNMPGQPGLHRLEPGEYLAGAIQMTLTKEVCP